MGRKKMDNKATISPELLDPQAPKAGDDRVAALEATVLALAEEVSDLRKKLAAVQKTPVMAVSPHARQMFHVSVPGKTRPYGFTKREDAERFCLKNKVDQSTILCRLVDEEGYPLDEDAPSRRRAVERAAG